MPPQPTRENIKHFPQGNIRYMEQIQIDRESTVEKLENILCGNIPTICMYINPNSKYNIVKTKTR
jgi:hypothetical protein